MGSNFYREYDLAKARQQRSLREPAAHQHQALSRLQTWFRNQYAPSGGILVLPTGGGKTFTAARFLCNTVLPQPEYKVLWLAHTHHLLDQAFYSFGPQDIQEAQETGYDLQQIGYEVGHITGVRDRLTVRVVSGGTGYFPVNSIKPNDDILICTLQTITKAYQKQHPKLEAFLETVKQDKLFVVFDEAHHLPAPSYRKLIGNLRVRFPKMQLLGLTATPSYTDKRKRGWLKEIFPQEVIYYVDVDRLIADGVLAKPIFEQPLRTDFTPRFDLDQYYSWVKTYQDLPESIITQLAQNEQRNAFIAETYARHRNKYGKTIIFADRWFQCEQLKTFLEHRDIRAGAVYSHIDADPGNAEARNKRDRNENAKVLDQFRRNELDVLINVRMLTEGTDVPDAKTVFLTRQTTSAILLTQMVGRALRGPKFGGTKDAYVVPFIDNWQQTINWATFNLEGGTESTTSREVRKQVLQIVSIDRVVQLTRQQDQGIGVEIVPFLTLLPVGWYQANFESLIADSENTEVIHQLVLVFDNEKES